MIAERLSKLRAGMKNAGIDFYIIPTGDYHNSEYVSDFFKCREYMSGFTGSAGTLVVAENEACLWTDGRYFIQAEEELKGTEIILYRSGNPGVPRIKEYLAKKNGEYEITAGKTITVGFDGRVRSVFEVRELEETVNGVKIISDVDLVGDIWTDRPSFPANPIYIFPEEYAGMGSGEKQAEIRRRCREKDCDYHMVASLDDIAWILNLRGSDIACNPVFLAYLFMSEDDAVLFCNKNSVDNKTEKYLEDLGVSVKDYDDVFEFCRTVKTSGKPKIFIDQGNMNYSLYKAISESFEPVLGDNPSTAMKAEKNSVEIENLREANVIDGIAMVKFLKWLDEYKNNPDIPLITETGAAEKLLEFRKESTEFIDISFDTISAYGAHGAIVHYEPTEKTDIPVERSGFLLVDSGAQYLKGTTDITRTIAMGDLDEDMKRFYTAVLKGNIRLSSAVFPKGLAGANLDILAREPIWKYEKDYNHGTGHGIGFFMNVHEGPQNINWKIGNRYGNTIPLACGMVTSDEPGFYLEGKFGIRIENDILTVKKSENEYGTFLGFEILTLAPIDLSPVIWEDMNDDEIEALVRYHQMVYDRLSPYLDKDTSEWLKKYISPEHLL